jgi:hypothetical protein
MINLSTGRILKYQIKLEIRISGKSINFFKFHGVQSRVIVITYFVLFSLVPNTNINFSDITVDKNWAPEEPHKEKQNLEICH